MRVLTGFGFALAVWTWVQPAQAETPPNTARLELTRAEGASSCIDAPRLTKAVEARLARRVFDPEHAALFVRVLLRREAKQFVAELELHDELGLLGRRELSAPARHCSALDDSLALVVALLVDAPPERATPLVQSEPSAAASGSAASPRAARAVSAPPPSATRLQLPPETLAPREPWQFSLRASLLGAVGLLPSIALGPQVSLGAAPPHGPLFWLSLEHFFAREAALSSDSGASISRQRVAFDVCAPDLFSSYPLVLACLGQRVGRLHAVGFGFSHVLDQSALSLAASLSLDAEFPVGRYLVFSLGAGAELALARHRFHARLADGTKRDVFSEPGWAGTLRAGVGTSL